MSTPATPPPTGPNKADPDTMALRASPRPVTRLNRRMLAVLAGTLGAVVLGGTLWSLQSHKRERNAAAELYNVDRVSRMPRTSTSCPRTIPRCRWLPSRCPFWASHCRATWVRP